MARGGLSRKRTHGSAVPQRGRASPSVSGTVDLPRAPTRASITSLCMVARRPADAVMRVYFIRTSRRGIMRYNIHLICSQSFFVRGVHLAHIVDIFRSRAHTGPRSAAGTASTDRGLRGRRRTAEWRTSIPGRSGVRLASRVTSRHRQGVQRVP